MEEVLDSVVLPKNIDRIIGYPDKTTADYLIATYHLDKETNSKTGSLTTVKITTDFK